MGKRVRRGGTFSSRVALVDSDCTAHGAVHGWGTDHDRPSSLLRSARSDEPRGIDTSELIDRNEVAAHGFSEFVAQFQKTIVG